MTNPMRLIDLKDQMLKVLSAAQKQRKERPGMTEILNAWGQRDFVPAWNVHELNVMLDEINRLRATASLAPVTLNDVMKVESQACGHSDYSSKFALYCAELTFKNEKEIQYP